MAEVSKISFGFTKSKAGSIKKVSKAPASIQYISCFDRNSVILKRTGSEKPTSEDLEEKAFNDAVRVPVPEKPTTVIHDEAVRIDPQTRTLEERAADELLRDAKEFNTRDRSDESQSLILQIAQAKNRVDSEVSTREDYEQVPVENFGLGLLRGMGWNETRGIGKKPQVVNAVNHVLRPKGIGLGAEKKNLASNNIPVSGREEEELKMTVGAYLMITSGMHRDKYGKILGFDEDTGRLIIELSCKGTNVSVNESAVQLVTKEHYNKNSRVLNAAKYASYVQGSELEHSDVDRKSHKRKLESR